MSQTRRAVFSALARLIWMLDDPPQCERELGTIARDHRKFGVTDRHYQPFFSALISTTEQVSGADWTPDAATAWQAAARYLTAVMTSAAADAGPEPAWWVGEIVQHDLRYPTIAVLTIRPDQPLSFRPGQYVAVQVPRWPRVWRNYSVANAPRDNGLLDLHVRAVPGGMVSGALVHHCGTGDTILLSAARGDLRVPDSPDRDMVCIAGGTGLAPVKAMIDLTVRATPPGPRRNITVYFGVRRPEELYDMRDLETLAFSYPSLTVVPVTEIGLDAPGHIGSLPAVVAKHPSFRDTDVYISGPAGLIAATVRVLSARVPAHYLHHDPLDLLRAGGRADAPSSPL